MSSSQGDDIIKKILSEMDAGKKSTNLTESDIRKKIKGVNREEVTKKLYSMGLGNVAKMMAGMTDEEIIKRISQNPAILKKLNKFL